MQDQDIRAHTFGNGLTLLVEPMADVQSAAFSLMVPAGSIYDPPGRNGTAALLCQFLMRGAGDRDSRALSAALDNLGLQRHEGVGGAHITFTGAALADNICTALEIYGDVVLRPRMPTDQLEAVRAGADQALRAVEDEPRQKIIRELRRRCYATPWGWPADGTLDDLPAITQEDVQRHYENCFRPNGAILGVAGRVTFDEVRDVVERVFGEWKPQDGPTFETGPRGPTVDHIEHDSTQTHIGIAYDSVPYRDPNYYASWAAVGVLSGGMSSRLFTEVRERRGLCYSVYATLNSLRDAARVLCYAGTTAERAQETLEVTLRELVRLEEGIEVDELDRCKARAKSSLIMQQESTSSRSSSVARDWYHLGRVMTLAEIRNKIDALSVETVLDYVREHPARDVTVLTIGPQALEVPLGVS